MPSAFPPAPGSWGPTGLTARAGASGKAVTLACEEYVTGLDAIEGLIGFKIPVIHVEDEPATQGFIEIPVGARSPWPS